MGRYLGDSLIPKVVKKINTRGDTTVVLCTVDEKGNPNSAPIGLIVAVDGKRVRFGIHKASANTLQNIKSNGKMCFALLEEDNIAITVNGTGSVMKGQMDCAKDFNIIEMIIESVKSDRSPYLRITKGVRVEKNEQTERNLEKMFKELEST